MPRITDPSFPLATSATLTDKVLGVFGGAAKNITLTVLKSLVSTTVENVLDSNSAVNALSAAQGKALKAEIDTKCPLVEGKVPSANLPSYVDDVLEYANLASFPNTGETGKLYIALDTNLIYRWTGSTYATTSTALALGETTTTAYRGDRGATAYTHSQAAGNPHGTAIGDIAGLQDAIDDAAVNFAAPTVNPQSGTSYTLGTVTTDNNGKTYLRMTSSSANTVTIPSTQTKPISISQRGTGTTTLVAGSGVTPNGTLAFTAQHQTKTVIPLGSGVYDIVG